ncbi:hypothetical protein [Natronomonas sp. EA1]|uniref:DUF7857 domain-containing protein n=1 Tax=Natronomonas sp. EA1 TaxID=3421655 RepID=UPI003EBF4058
MPDLTTETRRIDGVTYVECRLRASEPHRIVLENRLDGTVLPPRSRGVPERGWDETGFAGHVEAGVTGLGYATRASPREEPVELVSAEPASEQKQEIERSPEGVVRALGDPRPPRDAVPVAGTPSDGGEPTTTPAEDEPPTTTPAEDEPPTRGVTDVESWLSALETRGEQVEALAAVETLPEATDAVREAGGLAGVERLVEQAERDREKVAALRDRLAAVETKLGREVPIETLRRLA